MASLFQKLLQTYRMTLKRIPGMHRSLYFFSQYMALPLLERLKGFRTIPDDPLNFRLELLLGTYEPETVSFFKRYVKPGIVVLDVGAHVGYYTRLFSSLVGKSGLVIAFEPHPLHFHFLTKNVGTRPNVKLISKALGSEIGSVTLYESPIVSGSASLGWFENKWKVLEKLNMREISPRLQKHRDVLKWEVQVVTLDEILTDLGIPKVDIIKMDIEGAEVLALKGAKQVLEDSKALIVFEVAPDCLNGFGFMVEDLFELLKEYGYIRFGVLTIKGVKIYKPEQIYELTKRFGVNQKINCVASKEDLV